MHLIESDKRKAAFLREVSRETHANVEIHGGRIEQIMPELTRSGKFDIVSARALAPLDKLIDYAAPALDGGATCLFLKGKDARSELTDAIEASSLNITFAESHTDSAAQIVIVRRPASSTNFASRS
jgi:16S rRNA (guanine527-N7)-methyltransferase